MTKLVYVAQTFEPEHLSATASPLWFEEQFLKSGGDCVCMTADHGGLLIEVWKGSYPENPGPERWGITP